MVGLFATQKGINYPVFTAQEDIIEAYGVDSVPINIFLGRDGSQREKEKGYDEEKKYKMEEEIIKLLGEKD